MGCSQMTARTFTLNEVSLYLYQMGERILHALELERYTRGDAQAVEVMQADIECLMRELRQTMEKRMKPLGDSIAVAEVDRLLLEIQESPQDALEHEADHVNVEKLVSGVRQTVVARMEKIVAEEKAKTAAKEVKAK